MKIGESIRKNIQDSGLSIRQVAIKAGISSQTIYQWIWGINEPTLLYLICVADVLGLSLDELVGRTVVK